jgi:uncharacterized membrane protein
MKKRVGKKKDTLTEKFIEPFKSEFRKKDVLQIIIGASILSVPVGFTEETWRLGGSLPFFNVFVLMLLSLSFISFFVYFHYHRPHMGENFRHQAKHFVIRVFMTYILSFMVVGVLLTIINVAPWQIDFFLAFKRTVIVTFPSSMSAAVADVLK